MIRKYLNPDFFKLMLEVLYSNLVYAFNQQLLAWLFEGKMFGLSNATWIVVQYGMRNKTGLENIAFRDTEYGRGRGRG